MRANEPSATAVSVALHRAAHQLLDGGRIFSDPLAVAIVGPQGAAIAGQMGHGSDSRRWRAFMCARAAFAEECLAEAVEQRGMTQLVVLGAGLDTFAYRNPYEGRLKVIEVDHPATQQWKRQCLGMAGIAVPDTVRYASMDIERDDLLAHLEGVGLDRRAPAFFIFLGVLYYLKLATVDATLSAIAALGGQVVFDYSDPPETLSAFEKDALAGANERLAAAGEPMITFFEPEELHAKLRSFGFATIEDLDSSGWMTRYGETGMLAEWRELTGSASRGAHILSART